MCKRLPGGLCPAADRATGACSEHDGTAGGRCDAVEPGVGGGAACRNGDCTDRLLSVHPAVARRVHAPLQHAVVRLGERRVLGRRRAPAVTAPLSLPAPQLPRLPIVTVTVGTQARAQARAGRRHPRTGPGVNKKFNNEKKIVPGKIMMDVILNVLQNIQFEKNLPGTWPMGGDENRASAPTLL